MLMIAALSVSVTPGLNDFSTISTVCCTSEQHQSSTNVLKFLLVIMFPWLCSFIFSPVNKIVLINRCCSYVSLLEAEYVYSLRHLIPSMSSILLLWIISCLWNHSSSVIWGVDYCCDAWCVFCLFTRSVNCIYVSFAFLVNVLFLHQSLAEWSLNLRFQFYACEILNWLVLWFCIGCWSWTRAVVLATWWSRLL